MNEADKLSAAETKLQKLASRLNRGWDILHPVKAKHLEKIHEAIAQKWAKKQQVSKQNVGTKTKKSKLQSSQTVSAPKKKAKSKSKDHGQSH